MRRAWKIWGIVATLSTLGVSANLDAHSAIAVSSHLNAASLFNSGSETPGSKINLKYVSQGRAAYFDRNCKLTSVSNFDKFEIFNKFEFYAQNNQYWLYAGRYQDGAVQLCLSSKDYQNSKPLNAPKIQNRFIQSIVQDSQKKMIFYITVREGNGPGAEISKYILNLENPYSSILTSSFNAQSYKEQGDLYLKQEKWQNAIASYSESIRLSSRYTALYFNRGMAKYESRNLKSALADFETAAELYLQQQKHSDFQDAVYMILEINPSLVDYYKLTKNSRLRLKGIGPIRIGMTIEEAGQFGGVPIKHTGASNGSCAYYKTQGIADGIIFMTINDRIVRIFSNRPETFTMKGIKIGDTEEKIKMTYPGQISVAPHPIAGIRGGYQLTFIPKDKEDKNYRIIFGTKKGKVEYFMSGKLPEIEYPEGCF